MLNTYIVVIYLDRKPWCLHYRVAFYTDIEYLAKYKLFYPINDKLN